MENFDYEQMEMPTPCEHCGEIFDLNDGYGSEKWHKDVVICEKCYREEEAEIEEDERWEGINIDVSNALYELKEEGAWAKLTDENRALIIQLVSGSFALTGLITCLDCGTKHNGYCPVCKPGK
jgi:Fe2+ or Zn2+ uptake regulation protein